MRDKREKPGREESGKGRSYPVIAGYCIMTLTFTD
jgi:hypothetical protein